MTDKAYIVANEQQERKVLQHLETNHYLWAADIAHPTQKLPSQETNINASFPYIIVENENRTISWREIIWTDRYKIVYDGRKEKRMSEKYVVSQEFMNELEEWKKRGNTDVYFVGSYDISMLPIDVIRWWDYPEINNSEQNNRLIAIIRWVNGEDVFEVEKPKKWVVRSKYSSEAGEHFYVMLFIGRGIKDATTLWGINNATKFDTKEEAESWANSHQEVVEVVDV